ncbi:MAG: uracil-DNA glycosylase [Candidatus Hodarchaeales archaeon]
MTLKEEVLKLRDKCYICKECPLGRKLVDGRDPHVFGSGYVKSKMLFIAEAPGYNEVILKKPLVGRAGKFFDVKVLGIANIERSNILITNMVLCRPNEKNRTPLPAEIEICRQHLDAQICLFKPKLLITMGNVPLLGICGKSGITRMRGKLLWSREWSDGKCIPVFPIFHPSYCIRGSGLPQMNEDAKKIGEFYKHLQENDEIVVE